MIARRNVPFARADKNSALIVRRNRKFPAFVLQRIRRWDECDAVRVAARVSAPKNFSRFRSCRDAAIGLRDDTHESRKFCRVAQLLGYLMQPSLLERDHDDSFFFLAFKEGALGCFKISAQQKEDRSLFFNRVFDFSMK